MRLLWASLLCWALPPPAQGRAHSLIYLRISKNQLEIDISDLFAEQQILSRVVRVPVTGTPGEGATVLDHLPFVSKSLSKKSSGLDLSLVGDLLSGKSLPLLSDLLQAGGLVIEDARGPEVTLQILSDSLLQVTLRCKLYLSLQGILRLKVIKNIRMGVRLEQTGNRTTVALEECHTPPGSLSVEILGQGSVGLTINTPDPPTVHLIGHTATVTQQGSLVLLGPNSTSSSISWKLLSTATFSSTNQKLKLQFSPNSAVVTLGPYPAVLKKQEEQLRASLSQFLKRRFLPHHNAQLRGHSLPLPNVKGLSFNQAHMDLSEDYLLLTIPE
ncbi:hypothetical protein H1C71_018091 [Ictidomys tridecemlineatus]|nr:hypothetical protein H1C71_018091 [Ictidomys tridecemlineatus]